MLIPAFGTDMKQAVHFCRQLHIINLKASKQHVTVLYPYFTFKNVTTWIIILLIMQAECE